MQNRPSKVERLKSQVAKIERELSRELMQESRAERKRDTRRKILLGAIVLSEAQKTEAPERWLQDLVDPFLVRDDDRALFGLAPLER